MNKREELKKIKDIKNSNGGYVYVILAGDKTVKIGITKNPYKRISQIETASGKDIVDWYFSELCSNYKEIENIMHNKFKNDRLNGEWFNIDYNYAITKLNQNSFEVIEEDIVKIIESQVKSLELARQYMMEFIYEDYNYNKLKYNPNDNINISDLTKIIDMIEENYKYSKEQGECVEYLEEYLKRIKCGDMNKVVIEYCIDYMDLIADDEDLLKELKLYDLFSRILGFHYEKCNHIADDFFNKKIKKLYDKFGDEYLHIKKLNN